jgi:dipeptidyl aminopeptidase/acylaminoacyl peptidase
VAFYQALRAAGVPAEMHLYQSGGHGFGMENRTTEDRWMDRLRQWMKSNGWLNPEIPKK